jgi:cobalt-zinc-cadmium efflux system protein
VEEVESQIHQVNHVAGTHHTHIWSLEGEHHVFSTHVKLKDIPDLATLLQVKEDIKRVLKQYPFADFTVETELDGETCGMKDEDAP